MDRLHTLKKWLTGQTHLYFLFVATLLVPHLFLLCTEPMAPLLEAGFLLAPLGVYLALMLLFRKPGIMLWALFPLLFLGAFQLVLLYLFGESIIATDMFLNLFTTNPTEAFEVLDKLLPSVAGVVILYVPMLVLGVVSIRSSGRLDDRFRKKAALAAGVLFLSGASCLYLYGRSDKEFRVCLDVYPANVCYNIRLAAGRWKASENYRDTSAGFTFRARSAHEPEQREIYLMVIGETARALNWGLYGYGRNTTPGLQQTPGIVCFSDALSQANATHKSVPMLLSAASAEDFDRLYREKSVITAFREAGFRTAFFSNQLPNHSFIDYFADEADVHEFLKEDPEKASNPYDAELVKRVEKFLEQGDRKVFIVLHCYGSHFNYSERYPDSGAFFKPDKIKGIDRKERPALINAYDNSIRATDRMLASLMRILSERDGIAALMYTSDHGEDLLDDCRDRFLHSSPVPTFYQLHVPYLLWVSPAYDRLYPEIAACARTNAHAPVTTNTFFHTMLGVGGVDTPYRNDSLSVVSNRFRITTRHYLNDHNRPERLDQVGFKKEDVEMFRKLGLSYP